MKTLGLALLLATVLSGTPWAIETPRPGARDPNIRTQAYRSDSRILLVGTMRRSTTITFGTDESVVRMIFGDDEIWEGPDPATLGSTPLKNHLPLWPKKPGRTNLQVITSRPNHPDRVYQFATIVRDTPENGEDDPEATYGLTFLYNVREAAASAARTRPVAEGVRASSQAARITYEHALRQDDEAAARRILQSHYRYVPEAAVNTGINWRYVARGSGEIAPEVAFNVGGVTYFRFPPNAPLPAVFVLLADGSETATAPSMIGGYMTFHMVTRRFRLRAGSSVLDIINLGFNASTRSMPNTGTTRPNVRRELR